jgi:hypothetical protein
MLVTRMQCERVVRHANEGGLELKLKDPIFVGLCLNSQTEKNYGTWCVRKLKLSSIDPWSAKTSHDPQTKTKSDGTGI